MGYASAIEWTDATWNPVRGCAKISPGCKHCYAEVFAERWRGVQGHPYEFGFDLRLVPEKLAEPLTWTRSRKVFVNSMSDFFQEGVPDDFIARAFKVMQVADWHTYQVLTKRPERMKKLLESRLSGVRHHAHIWLGVSVEDRRHGLPRVDLLREAPAALRFLSVEPLLEDLGPIDLTHIDWVIVGGESGHGARPLERNWVNSILQQCRKAGVPFFFKQWGGVHKKRTGRTLNRKTYDEFPELEPRPVPALRERLRRAAFLDLDAAGWRDVARQRVLQES